MSADPWLLMIYLLSDEDDEYLSANIYFLVYLIIQIFLAF